MIKFTEYLKYYSSSIYESIELMEDRIQFLKDKESNLNTDHDPYAEHKKSGDIIDHFATHADPSKNKQHTQWIIHQYKKGHIRQEDHPRIKEALTNFDKYKGKLQNKDLNSYKHISDVEDVVEPHLGKHASKREETKQVKDEGSEVIHRGEDGAVVRKIKTKEAACHYGSGTRWCTAADKNNMFDSYNKNGPLYIIHHKDGSKHQIHFESGQSMNEEDKRVPLQDIIKKSPSLKNVKEFKGKHPAFDTHEEQKKHIESGENPGYISKSLDGDTHHSSETLHKAAMKLADAKGDTTDEDHSIQRALATVINHKNVTSETLNHIAKHNDDIATNAELAKSTKLDKTGQEELYNKGLKLKSNLEYIRHHLSRNPSTHPDILHKLAKEHPGLVAQNPNTGRETFKKILSDRNIVNQQHAASNPSLPEDLRAEALKQRHLHAHIALNPNLSDEHRAHLESHGDEYVKALLDKPKRKTRKAKDD